jgi:CheY-like chemotaxis protein
MTRPDAIKPVTTVLVVEDEPLIREMVADILQEGGFAVHAVATAGEALRLVASEAAIDILFTDLNLAGGMDGAVLAQTARGLRPDLPVVFASGRWTLLEALRCEPRARCLAKPFSAAQLLTALEALCPSQPGRALAQEAGACPVAVR